MNQTCDIEDNVRTRVLGVFVAAAVAISAASVATAGDLESTADDGKADWYSHGEAEVGVNIFIDEPPSGFGRVPGSSEFLTPRNSESGAKLNEYLEYPDLLSTLRLFGGKADGTFYYDFLAESVGNDNQHYSLDVQKTGSHYIELDWDEIPHILSTSGKTVFSGAGTTNLTVDDGLQAVLDTNQPNATASSPAGVEARTNIRNAINANVSKLDLDIQRKKGSINYKYTGYENWEFFLNHTNEERTGAMPVALNFATTGRATNIVEAIQPIDDRTQNLRLGGQYLGSTAWGSWVEQFQYYTSWYDNSLTALHAENPFCNGNTCDTTDLQLQLAPSNQAHAFTLNGLTDLPWNSRLTHTLQYNVMKQNDPFIDTSINGFSQLALPANSANAEVETFLSYNTLTTQINDRLTSKLSYRYYDLNNNTPELVWPEYIIANSSQPTEFDVRRNLAIAYTKQNAVAALTWRATDVVNLGGSLGWENYDRDRRDANVTDEYSAKIFGDARIGEGTTARGSIEYAQRRYDEYDIVAFVEHPADGPNGAGQFSENFAEMRKFDMADRDRLKIQGFLDIPVTGSLVITPTVGVDLNDYPESVPNQLGVKEHDGWNAGVDLALRINSDVSFTGGYNYEKWDLHMDDCCGSGNLPLTEENIWSSDVEQEFHTVYAGLNWQVIPDKLALNFGYRLSYFAEDTDTRPCTSGNNSCTGGGTGVTTTDYPKESGLFHRFTAIAEYQFDRKSEGLEDDLSSDDLSSKGPTFVAKLGYIFEKNGTTNWAIDDLTPYIPTPDQTNDLTGAGRSTFLAPYNPNYEAHIIAGSIAIRW